MVYANKKRGIYDSNFQETKQINSAQELTSMIELVPYFN